MIDRDLVLRQDRWRREGRLRVFFSFAFVIFILVLLQCFVYCYALKTFSTWAAERSVLYILHSLYGLSVNISWQSSLLLASFRGFYLSLFFRKSFDFSFAWISPSWPAYDRVNLHQTQLTSLRHDSSWKCDKLIETAWLCNESSYSVSSYQILSVNLFHDKT